MFRILPKSWFVALALVAVAQAQNTGPPPVQSFADSAKAITQPQTNASPIQRYATRSRQFTIPFSVVTQNQVIVEVLLHVSTDRGQRWEQYTRADLRQTEFRFAAPEDGEYWFAVQTLNRNGQSVPAKVAMPELIVVVDTQVPTIEATSGTDAAGRVTVDWRARDAQLATDSLSIRYRSASAGPDAAWTVVPAKINQVPSGPLLQDSYAFWPESNELNLELEISIRDQAGNQATTRSSVVRTQTSPQFAPIAGVAANSAPNPQRQASADNTLNSPIKTERNAGFRPRVTPATAPGFPTQDNSGLRSTASSLDESKPQAVQWRSAKHSSSGKFSARGSTQNSPAANPTIQPIQPNNFADQQAAPGLLAQHNSTRAGEPPNNAANLPSDPANFGPIGEHNSLPLTGLRGRGQGEGASGSSDNFLVADRSSSDQDSEPHSIFSQSPITSEIQSHAISVNTKRFRLNYQVEAIDPAGVKEVAVWVTRDVGKNWARLGSIEDANGPYPVEVDESGLYGFRLVVISHSGLKSRLPQPGDPADKWIRVDIDPPVAKITSAPYGSGEQAGKLVINWEARDDLLILRPIELSYSTRPDGPWTMIEKGLRNTGTYTWGVQPDAPDHVYLRLTVRDEAGNEQVDQTGYAIDISNLYPRGRIQSVDPIREK